ncbi:putative multicopper oxidase, type 3 [Medicago truncatula]|uniref:Putative multicopper oxidase, type 3 n=1 Tax=Medicago truncatula TaxID=3880 RepID=A0A396JS31_MEDTR|nr:putative multicopper oxidase, type 3 [Medicago truncatula]
MFKQHNYSSYTLWQSNKFEETNDCDRHGVQMRRNSWQDGVLGTNCPIPSKSNWTLVIFIFPLFMPYTYMKHIHDHKIQY